MASDDHLADVIDGVLAGSALDPPVAAGMAAMPLEQAARILGSYQWVERRLFEVLGAWVASEPDPAARLLFDAASQQHAWHARLFADRVPTIGDLDPASLAIPPSAEVDGLLGGLGGAPPGGTLLRLVALGRVVLPRLVAGYGRHLRRAAPVADGPVVRALRMVVRDDLESWQVTEALIQALLRRPNDVAVVTDHQQELEALLAGIGPGLVPWPD